MGRAVQRESAVQWDERCNGNQRCNGTSGATGISGATGTSGATALALHQKNIAKPGSLQRVLQQYIVLLQQTLQWALQCWASVAATPTRSRPEVKVETRLAENFVVTPRTRSATRSAELAATARL